MVKTQIYILDVVTDLPVTKLLILVIPIEHAGVNCARPTRDIKVKRDRRWTVTARDLLKGLGHVRDLKYFDENG